MEKCEYLKSFVFCPKCGGEFVDNNIKSKKCLKCGFTFYFNPSSAVVAIIKNKKGDILVAKRAKNPAKGTLDLPGGFVDSYETSEECVIREVKEECNINVVSLNYLFSLPNIYNYSNFDVHTLDAFYECEIDSFNTLQADDDVASLQFIPIKDINLSEFGLDSVRKGLGAYLDLFKGQN